MININYERANKWMKALGYLPSDKSNYKQHFDEMEQKYNQLIKDFTMSNEKLIVEQLKKFSQENQTLSNQEYEEEKVKIVSKYMSFEVYQQNEHFQKLIQIDSDRILTNLKFLNNPYYQHIEQFFYVNNFGMQFDTKEESTTTYLDVMKRILYIYCRLHPNIGYISGMNYLLAPILRVIQKEADCFFCFERLMERQQQYFSQYDNQKAIAETMKRFDEMIQKQEPQLEQYMNGIGVNISMFFVRWFITLFTSDLDIDIVIQLWDNMLWKDYQEYQFEIIIEVLRRMKKKILKSNFDQFVQLIQEKNENGVKKIINSILNK
ncbi:unnamed protein product [Paramecium sonneborni]|uniref:Rab-GAP TBC domain-containing protein n=1 Tax=Paramecium sonneborni TaxID=65129 RepID=A0A8S1N5I1_9CILI|nr:unnamed protein product [Paramecium sonneborni]